MFHEFREKVRAREATVLPESIRRAGWNRERLAAHQTARLRALLRRAADSSPFYARRLRGLDLERFNLEDLPRLPVLAKDEMMDRLDEVFTDRRLTRALAEDALQRTKTEPVPILGEYLAQATGGSSGRRGIFVNDVESLVEVSASALRGLFAHAAAMQPASASGLTLALVAAATPVHSTGLAASMNPPGQGPMTAIGVPVTLPFPEMVSRLAAAAPDAVMGYPTVLARLAEERSAGRLRVDPRLVLTTSETLTPLLRERIRRGFQAPVINLFGSTEGLMGSTAPDDEVFTFNSDVSFLEFVDADHRPVPVGTPSDHILLTNLANTTQPLIRYRIDDCFTRQADSAEHGHVRARVEGRADEPLRYGNLDVHPLAVRSALLGCPEVLDYQVHQTPRGIHVRALTAEAFETGPLARTLRQALAEAGLEEPEVEVAAVATLERQGDSGKLRRFVPLPAASTS